MGDSNLAFSVPRCVAVVCALTLTIPSPAAAQRDAFFSALIPFYRTLAGVYGDEGPQVTARLDEMSAALARWDEEIRDAERQLQPKLDGADAQTALQIHTLLASLYLERGRFADAVREFDEDIRLDPKRAPFHRFKGLALQALSRPAAAADAFRTAWLLDAEDPQNAYRLIAYRSTSTTSQEIQRALDTLMKVEGEQMKQARPTASAPFINVNGIVDDAGGAMAFVPAAYAPGFSLILRGERDTGVAALRAAAAADPLVTDPVVRSEQVVQGIAALRRGMVAAALTQVEAAVTRVPDSSEAHRVLATAYWVDGNIAGSVQHLRDAVRLNPRDERSWLALTRALDETGQAVEADAVLRAAVAAVPDAGALRWELVAAARKRLRTDDADVALINMVDRYVMLVGKGELYSALARLAQGHLDYERGISLLQQAVAIIPNNASAHSALGRAYLEDGRETEAFAELAIALLLKPDDSEALTEIGRLHLAAGRVMQAVEALQRAVALDVANVKAVHALGTALIRVGRDAEGQQRLEESERLEARTIEDERRQRTAGMLRLESEVRMDQQDYQAAADLLKQLIAAQRGNAATHLRLADALVALKRIDEAAAELQTAISLKAGADAHRRLAEVFDLMDRRDDAARERETYAQRRLAELQLR